jgi:three-Cys-motif partner protein
VPEPAARDDVDDFFETKKKPAAVLKHAVLEHYLPVFAAKTGAWSKDHQVVIVDGYAGADRYSPGDAGSPALIARTSLDNRLQQRRIRALLVEADADTYGRLTRIMEREPAADTFTYDTFHGDVQEYMPALLAEAAEFPLLMFLDPFGLGPNANDLTAIFASRATTGAGGQQRPTEVLLRFDARFIGLVRGHLRKFQRGEGQGGTASLVQRMDHLVGGQWWQSGSHLTDAEFKQWLIVGYVDRLRVAINGFAHYVPVTQSIGRDVKYYLVFLTLRSEGFFTFLETTSGAFEEWRLELRNRPEDVYDDEDVAYWGITDEQMLAEHQDDETRLAAEWIMTLQHNIRDVLSRTATFVLADEYPAVFGDLLGYARTKHLRSALRELHTAGVLTGDLTGELWFKVITAANS